MVFYALPVKCGTDAVTSLGDANIINVSWFLAYPSNQKNSIAYNIYFSEEKKSVFSEGIKYTSIDGSLQANIINLTPGQDYWFAVRPVEYNPNDFDLSSLPIAYDNLRYYPTSILRSDVSATDLVIPLVDGYEFPNNGVIKIGVELVQYSAKNNNDLLLNNINQRGYNDTLPTIHTIAGFDGYANWSPIISIFTIGESKLFDRIFVCQNRFEYPNFAYTTTDGYRQVTEDLLTSDLMESDAANQDFPAYNYSGWHRTDPTLLLNGTCVGSYLGGAKGCIDQFGNVNLVRGFNLQEVNNARQEVLLSVDGRPAVLLRREQTGINCNCYTPSQEYPDDRCPNCHGTKFIMGYNQFFDPRRSDGRIMIRLSPTGEILKPYDSGLESELPYTMWTLTVPTIKNRDIIVLYLEDKETEEFRYEVGTVSRNNTVLGQQGAQIFNTYRVRKFDPIYQIPIFKDTSMFPYDGNTTISSALPAILPHSHSIRRNEKNPATNIQITGVSMGHSHDVINVNGTLTVMESLGHSHKII